MPSSPGNSESGQHPPDGRTDRPGPEGGPATTVQNAGPPPADAPTEGEAGRTPTEAQLDAELAQRAGRASRNELTAALLERLSSQQLRMEENT